MHGFQDSGYDTCEEAEAGGPVDTVPASFKAHERTMHGMQTSGKSSGVVVQARAPVRKPRRVER